MTQSFVYKMARVKYTKVKYPQGKFPPKPGSKPKYPQGKCPPKSKLDLMVERARTEAQRHKSQLDDLLKKIPPISVKPVAQKQTKTKADLKAALAKKKAANKKATTT